MARIVDVSSKQVFGIKARAVITYSVEISDLREQITLQEDAGVEKEESEGGGDAEEEAAEVQARVDGAGVTDAGDEKDGVGQDGESKPSETENFRVERVPVPTGKIHNQESEHGGAQRDDGGGGDGVAARKAHIGVQENKQEGDRILGHHDGGDESAVAGVRLAEEVCFGKEDRRDERVRERGDAQRDAKKMLAWAGSGGVLYSIPALEIISEVRSSHS